MVTLTGLELTVYLRLTNAGTKHVGHHSQKFDFLKKILKDLARFLKHIEVHASVKG